MESFNFKLMLEGYTVLWNLVKRAENDEVCKKTRNLLVYLHTSLNRHLLSQIKEIREDYLKICFEDLKKLRSEESPKSKILRCFDLIHTLIDMSHIVDKEDNLKRQKLYCEIDKGKLFKVEVEHKSAYWKQKTIQIYSNMLVCDLFSKCKKQFHLEANAEIYLQECILGLAINTFHTTRTLWSLSIKDDAKLELYIRSPPEAYLIQYDNTLNPKAKEIFAEWFENYSDNGKMNAEHYTAFADSCSPDIVPLDPRRIIKLFEEFDDDKDCYLTLDNFLKFYFQACKSQDAVWKDLSAHKINRCLKKQKSDISQNQTSPACDVISLISSNDNFINLLFSFLELEDEIASETLELLNRLPTNPRIFSDIVMLKGVKNINNSEKPNWSHIFDRNHKYKLLYCLNIVEYLVGRKKSHANDDIDLWSLHPELLKHKKTWLFDF